MRIQAIAFSPDGLLLAVASKGIEIWNIMNGVPISNSYDPVSVSNGIGKLGFSANNGMLAAASEIVSDESAGQSSIWHIHVLDVATGSCIGALSREKAPFHAIAFSADGKWLATMSRCSTNDKRNRSSIHIFNWVTGCWDKSIDYDYDIVGMAISSTMGNCQIAVTSEDGLALLEVLHTELKFRLKTFNFRNSKVSFSSNGKRLALTTNGNTIIRDTFTGSQQHHISGIGKIEAIELSRDGKQLAIISSYDSDIKLKLLNVARCQEIRVFPNVRLPCPVSFSPNGSLLAESSNTTDMVVNIWDTEAVKSSPSGQDRRPRMSRLVVSASGDRIVSIPEDISPVEVWDVSTASKTHDIYRYWSRSPVAALSHDGTLLAVSSSSRNKGTTAVLDIASEEALFQVTETSYYLSFSPDGSHFALLPWEKPCQVWEIARHSQMVSLGSENALSAGFSPNGKKLVLGHNNGIFKVWDIASGRLVKDFCETANSHTWISSVAFLSDRQIATLTPYYDVSVRVWDIDTGTHVLDLRLDDAFVNNSLFMAEPGRLITSSGSFSFDLSSPESFSSMSQDTVPTQQAHRQGPALSRDLTWILWKR